MLELDIQLFADGKVVIDTELDTKNFENGLDKMKNSAQKGGNSIKNIVVGLGITKLIGTAFNTITSNMDSAIKRLDTLNNFPKVMSNLGIGAEEANKSISKMSDKLIGLPTTLDQGAMAVQRFTSANGDVAKSTDLFLALNNAILAGGASSEIQSSALEQLSQAYAKGKPDMMEWRTAMTAMPAQLKQVATAMGFVDASALGEALRDGSVSMEDFMDTITKLNTEGVDGFKSFEEQARNSTGGLQTTIANAKNAVVRGVAGIVEALDKGLKNAGLGGLTEVIQNIGKAVESLLEMATPYITSFVELIANLYEWVVKNQDILIAILVPIGAFVAVMQTAQTIINLVAVAQGILNAVMLANPITLVIAGIVALVAGFIYLWNNCDAFKEFWIKLWDKIKEIVNAVVEWFKGIPDAIGKIIDNIIKFIEKIPYYVGYVIGWVVGKIVEFVTKTLPNFIKNVITTFQQLPSKIWNAIVSAVQKIYDWGTQLVTKGKESAKRLVDAVINGLKNLPSKVVDTGKNIVKGLWNGITGTSDWLKNKVKDFAKGILDGMKSALGIHSPSRLFRDQIGKNIALGVGEGFTDNIKSVFKDMQQAVDFETEKMTANVQTSGTYQMATKGEPTFNLRDNSTNTTQLVVNGKVLAETVNTENRNREVARA